MRTISYKLDDLKKVVIPIGYEGENDHTRVIIDAGEVFKQYPAAAATLKVKPPHGTIYPVVVSREGDTVIWDVKETDCASNGTGEAQFTFTENSVIVKSMVTKININRSLVATGPAPDPIEDWLDNAEEVLDDLAAMDNIAKTAEAGDVGKALSPKTVENGVVTEWQYVEPGGGTEDYTDLENKPQIGGVELSGDKSLHDLGIAAESAIPDVSGKANLSVVAPAFDQATANDAGSLVTYTDGVVYVLPEGHTAGITWANTQKTATNIAEQQRLLKKVIQGIEDNVGLKIDKPSTPGTQGQALLSDGSGGQAWGDVLERQSTIAVNNGVIEMTEGSSGGGSSSPMDLIDELTTAEAKTNIKLEFDKLSEFVVIMEIPSGSGSGNVGVKLNGTQYRTMGAAIGSGNARFLGVRYGMDCPFVEYLGAVNTGSMSSWSTLCSAAGTYSNFSAWKNGFTSVEFVASTENVPFPTGTVVKLYGKEAAA